MELIEPTSIDNLISNQSAIKQKYEYFVTPTKLLNTNFQCFMRIYTEICASQYSRSSSVKWLKRSSVSDDCRRKRHFQYL